MAGGLTDAQWALLAPLLPSPKRRGRKRAEERATLNGILFVLRTGCRWKDIPHQYGAPTTLRLRSGQALLGAPEGLGGGWDLGERVCRTLLGTLDAQGKIQWDQAPGWQLCPGKKGGAAVELTHKGKGTKWMLVTDGQGLPLGLHLASVQRSEVRLAEATLATVWVAQHHGRARTRPRQVVADRGYDSRALRQALRRRGIRPCIPP